ncbi:hypothetical protein J2T02_004148 [Chitinophaga terrae (ex Kim and Jung 2007)]|uniref:SMI1/KNR4 family protein n=1 Tax=Chitinophaga terrae (ex Kim and Jung 2007) TaxID=408074 RepID=UPI00277DA92B|nr:SMI1/KNR4 family protein [Chitinophaga terrae (ex Kim and Jung 2007)]MDQ0109007.1 hypothetical protein [Chitinophaga terrae (ex Kim and Jung 2007)]
MTDPAIEAIQQALDVTLPAFYIEFLQQHALEHTRNFNDLTSLLGVEDVVQRNRDYEIQRWMPGYVMIGNDSGDYGILVRDAVTNDPRIYLAGLGVLSVDDTAILDHSIATWAERGYPCDSEEVVEPSPYTRQREAAMEAYRLTPDYLWHQRAGELQLELNTIEKAKAGKAIDLKTYLARKKEIQANIALHEANNDGYLPFHQWWMR